MVAIIINLPKDIETEASGKFKNISLDVTFNTLLDLIDLK